MHTEAENQRVRRLFRRTIVESHGNSSKNLAKSILNKNTAESKVSDFTVFWNAIKIN